MFNVCEYVISTTQRSQSPNTLGYPEFIFLGRSNVGKSSFINALTNRKMLARTSSKPGKTQTINYFIIDNMFYLCDAPGYGYASRSYGTRINYGEYIEDYLQDNPNLKIVFLLVDTFVGPTEDDILMYDYLSYFKINIVIIGTKCDKVGKSKVLQYKKNIYTKLNILDQSKIILTSSNDKIGFDIITDLISSHLKSSNEVIA